MSDDLPAGVRGKLVLPAKAYSRNRAPWLTARRAGIGASDMAALLGMNPWRSAVDVWFEKTDTTPVTDVPPSEAAEWGTALEDAVARKAVARHPHLGKLVPSPGLVAHEEHPWMLATVDRLLAPRLVRPLLVDGGMEVKTTSPGTFEESWHPPRAAEHAEHGRLDWPPFPVQIQVQQQMAVLGLTHIWVVVLVGGQRMPAPYRIERDETVIEQLIEFGGMWWDEYVVKGSKPEPTVADRENLSRLWPGDPNLDPIVADDDLVAEIKRFLRARQFKVNAESVMADARFNVEKRLGDATEAVDEDGRTLVTWKPQTSRRIDTGVIRDEYPDVAAAATRVIESRVFRPKEIVPDD